MCATVAVSWVAIWTDRPTTLIYALVSVSAGARVAAGFGADAYLALLALAGAAWFAAFAMFLFIYGPMLLAPRAAPGAG